MADPFAVMNRAIDREKHRFKPGSRQRKVRDPNNPEDAAYLRAMHPDFDELMASGSIDYRTQCHTDAQFANRFQIPPLVEPVRSFHDHTNSVDAVCWGPQPGTFISASHDRTLKVWDVASGKCLNTLAGHAEGVFHCDVARSGQHMVSCGAGETKNALIWQWPQARVCQELKGHRVSVHHAVFVGEGRLTATSDKEGTIAIHDITSGSCTLRQTLHLGVAHGTAPCREDPNLLITFGHDGVVQLLDLRERSSPPSWLQPSMAANSVSGLRRTTLGIIDAHDGHPVYAAEFTDRNTIFSVGADHKLKCWDLRSLSPWEPVCLNEYLGHTAPVRSLSVSQDQRFITTGCEDGSCRVWRKDQLGDIRASKENVRTQISQTPDGAKKEALKESSRVLRADEQKMMRNGYSTAMLTLNGHVSLVSGCAWKETDSKAASILSCSWDQRIQLFNVDLQQMS